MSNTIRVLEVVLPCSRYIDTRRFYERVLELEVVSSGRSHVFFNGGSVKIALVAAEPEVGPPSLVRRRELRAEHMHLDLAADLLAPLRRRLEDNGVTVESERDDRHGQSISVRDPEGNLLNIFQEGTFE